jgi:hypothetical protein
MNLGVIVEENDEGRSRRHSGSSNLDGYGGVSDDDSPGKRGRTYLWQGRQHRRGL